MPIQIFYKADLTILLPISQNKLEHSGGKVGETNAELQRLAG